MYRKRLKIILKEKEINRMYKWRDLMSMLSIGMFISGHKGSVRENDVCPILQPDSYDISQ